MVEHGEGPILPQGIVRVGRADAFQLARGRPDHVAQECLRAGQHMAVILEQSVPGLVIGEGWHPAGSGDLLPQAVIMVAP